MFNLCYSEYLSSPPLLPIDEVWKPGLPRCEGEIYLRHMRFLPTFTLQSFLYFPYNSLQLEELSIRFPYNRMNNDNVMILL